MSPTVFATLSADGEEIEGAPGTLEMGGDDVSSQHRVLHFHHELSRPTESQSAGHASGKVDYGSVVFRVNWSSGLPLLLEAFAQNKVIVAIFAFYRPNSDTGAMEKFATVEVSNGRALRLVYEFTPSNGGESLVADLELSFQTLEFQVLTPTFTTATIEAGSGSEA